MVQKAVALNYELNFDYHQMNEVMMIVKQYHCNVLYQEAQLFVQLKLGIPKHRLEEVLNKLNELRDLRIELVSK